MSRQSIRYRKLLPRIIIPVLALSLSISADAATSTATPKAGEYCPAQDIRLVIAEGLSTSLDLAMRSRAALLDKDQALATSELTASDTVLHLAASRGAAARTSLLIDTVIESMVKNPYSRTLTWFPLLQTSLMTLPYDPTVSAADDLIGNAEDIMQGDKEGDPMISLKDARHMLACDKLDIPLQQAITEEDKLASTLGVNTKVSAYDDLLDSLHRALTYVLENSKT